MENKLNYYFNFDIYASSPNFYFNNHDKINTWFGTLLTIIYMRLLILPLLVTMFCHKN